MRIDITAEDRIGITQEILATMARLGIDLRSVEVVPNHLYVDAPALLPDRLVELRKAVALVPGVSQVATIALLPGEQRRFYLDALLAALPDPVLALDGQRRVAAANAAATRLFERPGAPLPGLPADAVLGAEAASMLASMLMSGEAGPREVTLAGHSFLIEVRPLPQRTAGALVLLQTSKRVARQIAALDRRQAAGGFDAVIGDAPALQLARERATRFAALEAPLLILGETGTGKELFARAVHEVGPRAKAAFVALNCAALPENLVESELFGYAPGAFTGGVRGGKPGLLEMADGGTVFLDEIGEMSPYVQSKLLRFLQDGSFRRIGGQEERRVKVRIVGATHRNLTGMAGDGDFRADLLYRLAVLTVEVPPLRARPGDIPRLVDAFLERAATQVGRPMPGLAPGVVEALMAQPWPGNVRQLQNVLFRAVALNDGGAIGLADLELAQQAVPAAIRTAAPSMTPAGDNEPESLSGAVAAFERDLLARLWPRYPSSRKLAARLGVSHATIADKLRRYRVGRPDGTAVAATEG